MVNTMEFSTLLNQLKKLNLPPDSFVIANSGALAVRGLREANDLDIIVIDELWTTLSQKYSLLHKGEYTTIPIGDIEVYGNSSNTILLKIASLEEQLYTADIINGLRYTNLEIVKKTKQHLGREKDLKDILLIEQYLERERTTQK